MAIHVREARNSDLPRILAITNEAIIATTSVWDLTPTTLDARRAWMRQRREGGFPVLVIEADGAVVGFGSFGPFRAWDGYIHTVEHSLYVDPSWQGRGFGTALLDTLVAEAKARELHAMIAGIEAENIGSMALHRWTVSSRRDASRRSGAVRSLA